VPSLALIALVGCGPAVLVIPLEPPQNALLVTVGDGAVVAGARWASGTLTTTLAFPEDSSVAVFRFEPSAFAWRGEGRWTDHLPGVSTDEGGCHRCYAPQEAVPRPAYAGESCPIPSDVISEAFTASFERDEQLITELRRKILLDWPGRPGCLRVATIGGGGGFAPDLTFLRVVRAVTPAEGLTPELLGTIDVLVFLNSERAYTSTEAVALEAWVRGGGGVIALNGFGNREEPERSNVLFRPLGFEFFGPEMDGEITFGDHPTVRGVGAIPVGGVLGVRGTDRAEDLTVARLPGGPLAIAAEHGRGRIFAWGDDLLIASVLAHDTSARLLWANALGWTARR